MPNTIVYLCIKAKINHSKCDSPSEVCDRLAYNSVYYLSLLDDDGDEQVSDTEILSIALTEESAQ